MADYIIEPLDTDSEAIYQSFVEFVQTYYPDWNPSDGQLDVVIARFFSMQVAYTADMASRVLRAIYRYFGASLAGIQPLPGAAATAVIEFTISPAIAQTSTLPYGSLVGLIDADGDVQMFATLDDMVVNVGQANASMDVQAVELGVMGNGLSGSVELVEMVDWIDAAVVQGVSSGGADPEEDDIYIQRLTDNLALMAPRPIIAVDFATIAQNVPGVWRAAAIDNYNPGAGGTWTLDAENTIGISAVDQAGNPVIGSTRDALLAYLQSIRQQNFVIHYVEPSYNEVDINYAGVSLPTAVAASVQTAVEQNLATYLDKSTWGQTARSGLSRDWVIPPPPNRLRYLDLTTVVENTEGYDYTQSLTFSLNNGPMNSTDKDFVGAFPLPTLGTIGGTRVSQG